MVQGIIPRQTTESEADFYRRCARVFNQRATTLLRTGRNPEQAATLAAAYTQRAQALEAQAVTR